MNKPPIDLEISRSIAVIRFCKPKERNPLAKRTLDVFEEILTGLKIKPDLNAIIVTGTDDVFLSGADIRELKNLDSQSAIEFSRRGQLLTNALGTLPQLTIAAINGYCMGGGYALSASGTFPDRVVVAASFHGGGPAAFP